MMINTSEIKVAYRNTDNLSEKPDEPANDGEARNTC